ncbi:hypothetical protein FKM82_004109 [Ascaphus truei]
MYKVPSCNNCLCVQQSKGSEVKYIILYLPSTFSDCLLLYTSVIGPSSLQLIRKHGDLYANILIKLNVSIQEVEPTPIPPWKQVPCI